MAPATLPCAATPPPARASRGCVSVRAAAPTATAARVQVGEPVVVIVEDKSLVPAFTSYSADDAQSGPSSSAPPVEAAESKKEKPAGGSSKGKQSSAPAGAPAKPAAPPPPPQRKSGERVIASPHARKLAIEAGVALDKVSGSGPGGRIVAADVQQAVESGAAQGGGDAASAATGGADAFTAFSDVSASQIKKVTARRLLESKTTVPHYYLTMDCNVDALAAMRARMNAGLEATGGGKVSVNDFVIKAAAAALKKVPEVNASWRGDFIRQFHNVDVTVAVQTEAGLMVPVVRDADLKGLSAIAAEVRDLAAKVRAAIALIRLCRAQRGHHAPQWSRSSTVLATNLPLSARGTWRCGRLGRMLITSAA